jgi:pyruvate/2-oxoglutarate dehydrogenase complex dihydrolipoamide acyltransferase (E2) component
MIYNLAVPAVAEDVEEFRVLEWHGELDSAFEADDLIVELETHKAIIEVRAGQNGYCRRRLTPAGAWCKIGVPLGLFSDTLEDVLPDDATLAESLAVAFEVT